MHRSNRQAKGHRGRRTTGIRAPDPEKESNLHAAPTSLSSTRRFTLFWTLKVPRPKWPAISSRADSLVSRRYAGCSATPRSSLLSTTIGPHNVRGTPTSAPNGAQRREIWRRDRCCRFPGCQNRIFTQPHHIKWWSKGGSTDIPNLALLCSFHHHLMHSNGWSAQGDANAELTFTGPNGRTMRSRPHRCGPPRRVRRAAPEAPPRDRTRTKPRPRWRRCRRATTACRCRRGATRFAAGVRRRADVDGLEQAAPAPGAPADRRRAEAGGPRHGDRERHPDLSDDGRTARRVEPAGDPDDGGHAPSAAQPDGLPSLAAGVYQVQRNQGAASVLNVPLVPASDFASSPCGSVCSAGGP